MNKFQVLSLTLLKIGLIYRGSWPMARKTASDFFDSAETKDKLKLDSETKTSTDEAKVKNDLFKSEEDHNLIENSELGSEQESEDSKEPLEPVATDIATTEANSDTTAKANVTDDANQQYMQYMMQYQQYFTQYYSQYYPQPQPSMPATSDPAYEFYTNTTGPVAPAASFESTRANKQMNAYFDPNKFQAVLSPEMQAAQRAVKEQQQARLSAKEIEAFKKKKVEKKKAKNRWFYE